jgi:hypothetical protein
MHCLDGAGIAEGPRGATNPNRCVIGVRSARPDPDVLSPVATVHGAPSMSVTQLPDRTIYAPPVTEPHLEPAPSPPSPTSQTAPAWSVATRIGFRFVFSYFVLYLFPFPLSQLPIPGNPMRFWGQLEQWLAFWTETHLFGLATPVPVVPTGSGDTMAQWASQVNWLLIALGATIVWTLLDRKRAHYARLSLWLRVYVRFGLATIMFGYGFAKIIPTQMPAPQLERLVEPWGEFSPMGVLWSFMGYSSVYQIFTGFGEAIGAFLLVFRRTTTLGALLLCAVLANVVLMNYTFDVPVKLYSTNLLLMAIFLAAPDAKRLFGVLVLNRGAEPRPMPPLLAGALARRIAAVVVAVGVAYVMGMNLYRGLGYYRTIIGPNAPKSALWGIWDVEAVAKNGVDQPLVISDSTLLKRVVFGGLNRATFRLMADSVERYGLKVDSVKHEITLTGRFDPKTVRTMTYAKPDSQHLVLGGRVGGDSLVVRLRKFDERRFTLVNRGFNWIQELPFNR